MAKAKKRVATRKKSSKRGKPSAEPARKKAAKRTTPKKAKSKVQRAVRGAAKPMAKKQRPSKIAARKAPRKAPRQVVEVPVEDTIIDVIEEPVPGVVVVTEYETIRTATPISSDREPKPDTARRRKNNKPIHGMRPESRWRCGAPVTTDVPARMRPSGGLASKIIFPLRTALIRPALKLLSSEY